IGWVEHRSAENALGTRWMEVTIGTHFHSWLLSAATLGSSDSDAGHYSMNVIAWVLVASPVAVALYAYVGYPALLAILGRRAPGAAPPWIELPRVTIIVPAYNEEKQIAGAIDALLAQDYPADRRQILILSDGSADQTDAIVSTYAARGVELLRMPVRSGKTAAENAAVEHIRGEIVINSDASIRLHPAAVS